MCLCVRLTICLSVQESEGKRVQTLAAPEGTFYPLLPVPVPVPDVWVRGCRGCCGSAPRSMDAWQGMHGGSEGLGDGLSHASTPAWDGKGREKEQGEYIHGEREGD